MDPTDMQRLFLLNSAWQEFTDWTKMNTVGVSLAHCLHMCAHTNEISFSSFHMTNDYIRLQSQAVS